MKYNDIDMQNWKECEELNCKYIRFDINPQMIQYVNNNMSDGDYDKKKF